MIVMRMDRIRCIARRLWNLLKYARLMLLNAATPVLPPPTSLLPPTLDALYCLCYLLLSLHNLQVSLSSTPSPCDTFCSLPTTLVTHTLHYLASLYIVIHSPCPTLMALLVLCNLVCGSESHSIVGMMGFPHHSQTPVPVVPEVGSVIGTSPSLEALRHALPLVETLEKLLCLWNVTFYVTCISNVGRLRLTLLTDFVLSLVCRSFSSS